MQSSPWPIQLYTSALRPQVVDVWERSVRATHHFLQPGDIDYYKALVAEIDFEAFPVYCTLKPDNAVAGFIGVAGQRIEMLFIDPEYMGQGLGKMLLRFAIDKLHANEVEVNEENRHAVAIYQRFGFETCRRTPFDSQGKPYPILTMQLPGTDD